MSANACRGEWEKIGTVVGGPGEDTVAAGNQFHQGQQYDFVFDVDVADGMPPLKLPVNKGDNPYIAADKYVPPSCTELSTVLCACMLPQMKGWMNHALLKCHT